MEPIHLTKTQRGKIKLGYKGYLYNEVTRNASSIRFRCEMSHNKKCPGRQYTNLAMTEIVQEEKSVRHNHLPDHKNIQLVKVKEKIKSAAKETDETTAQIISAAIPQLSKEALPVAPTDAAMARLIQRSRYKKDEMRPEPDSFFDLQLTDGDKSSTDGETFLLFDSSQEGVEAEGRRLIIWATKSNMTFLAKAESWNIDGTYKCRPRILRLIGRGSQLYVILAPTYGQVYVPLVYALCSHKDEEMYDLLFGVLSSTFEEYQLEAKLKSVTLDFETAAAKSVRNAFPMIRIIFCFFHFCQILWRKVQQAGLQAQYSESSEEGENLRMGFAMICSLAFVPSEDIIRAYEALVPTLTQDLLPVAEHLDYHYIRGKPLRNANRHGQVRRARPLFDIEDWNHYHDIKTGCPKTNNIVEGWNNRLSHVVGPSYPSFARFIRCLKLEQKHSEAVIAQALSGQKKANVTKKSESRQKALQTLALDYENRDILDYLRGTGHNLDIVQIADLEEEEE